MAEAVVRRETNFERKMEELQNEIHETFDKLFQALEKRKQDLLSQLSAVQTAHNKNIELEEAVKQLRIVRDNAVNAMTSNLLKENIDSIRLGFEKEIQSKEEMKMKVMDLNFIEFRCSTERILKAIEETDLVELIPEYVGRENPILKKCSKGTKNGEFVNPRGIVIDRNTNEVYIADRSNHRIQVLSIDGEFLRSFKHDKLNEPFGICLSKNDIFVTDQVTHLLKFNKSGKYLKQAGSRGITPGCFTTIAGLCCEEGLVYVCDFSMQQIQIFDLELNFMKTFAYGEIRLPVDISVHSNTLYILSKDQNSIYCYNKDLQLLNTVQLTGQKIPMTVALFFTIDSKGNFLISDLSNNEIRIFSPNGVLKHTLGRGHLQYLAGIALDNTGAIVCVITSKELAFRNISRTILYYLCIRKIIVDYLHSSDFPIVY